MKLGFIIIAHNNFEQLSRLVSQILTYENSWIYIFIDAKQSYSFNEINSTNDRRVIFVENTFPLNWGDSSLNDATEELMKLAIKDSCDYISLLSGADLCIRSVKELAEFLELEGKDLYFSVKKMPVDGVGHGMGGLERIALNYPKWMRKKYTKRQLIPYVRALYQIVGSAILPKKSFGKFSNIDFYFGSQWFTVSGSIAQRAVEYINSDMDFKKVFKSGLATDEMYFQTIFMIPSVREGANYCFDNNLRYIDWNNTNTVESGSPRLLRFNDIDSIEKSQCFFARKFNQNVDKEVVDYFIKKTIRGM